MEQLIERKLAALKDMTPTQLRERYAELYGEPSRSGNKQWLIRRCAWRIQALAEGGLIECDLRPIATESSRAVQRRRRNGPTSPKFGAIVGEANPRESQHPASRD